MKKLVIAFGLLLCAASSHAKDKPNPADYNIKIHISASHQKTECVNGLCNPNTLSVDAILNGKKIELSGNAVIVEHTVMLISPGDYSVKIIRDAHNSDSTLFNQEYDLLLPDNTVWHCTTTGVSE
jgi:hypothetical protein